MTDSDKSQPAIGDAATAQRVLNVAALGRDEAMRQLKLLVDGGPSLLISHVDSMHGFGAGLSVKKKIEIEGDIGDLAFAIADLIEVTIKGNAGKFTAHSLAGGSLLVHGNVGDGFGAFAVGGFIATLGRGGNRAAMGLDGAEVIIRSDCGDEAGLDMRRGTLVLGNSVGEQLGLGMTGGTIFVRGVVRSIASNIKEVRLKDTEALRLGLMLARAGIRAAAKEFRMYRVVEGAE